ncbi:hypothetical protein BCR37DRAFT_266144 [Protomyces lactucae-debilis]|uniref:Myb-like domain-containing protein n=1 Tax=Protomyces lactucae-debilis TaxID=2754530 RepID=A0A1Y2FNY4_PROLT|nr:uncharacterized protein BCR37DRAFT_266144 [Protomyces lactucae-debilis]ORY84425.1 hypothetical protein BCR37DRAFT_266144 [Protomyces lactucae-debilis]
MAALLEMNEQVDGRADQAKERPSSHLPQQDEQQSSHLSGTPPILFPPSSEHTPRLWPSWFPPAFPTSAGTYPVSPSFTGDHFPPVFFHGFDEHEWSPSVMSTHSAMENQESGSSAGAYSTFGSNSNTFYSYASAPSTFRSRSKSYDESYRLGPHTESEATGQQRLPSLTPSQLLFRPPLDDFAASQQPTHALSIPSSFAYPTAIGQLPAPVTRPSLPSLSSRRASVPTPISSTTPFNLHMSSTASSFSSRSIQAVAASSVSPPESSSRGSTIVQPVRSRSDSHPILPSTTSPYTTPVSNATLRAERERLTKGWSQEDDLLIIELKRRRNYTWKQIQRGYFPDKRASALQVHYSRHLSRLTESEVAAKEDAYQEKAWQRTVLERNYQPNAVALAYEALAKQRAEAAAAAAAAGYGERGQGRFHEEEGGDTAMQPPNEDGQQSYTAVTEGLHDLTRHFTR